MIRYRRAITSCYKSFSVKFNLALDGTRGYTLYERGEAIQCGSLADAITDSGLLEKDEELWA